MIYITWFDTLESKLFRGLQRVFWPVNTHVKQDESNFWSRRRGSSVHVYSLALILCRAHSHSIQSFELFPFLVVLLDNWVSRFSKLISTSTSGLLYSRMVGPKTAVVRNQPHFCFYRGGQWTFFQVFWVSIYLHTVLVHFSPFIHLFRGVSPSIHSVVFSIAAFRVQLTAPFSNNELL